MTEMQELLQSQNVNLHNMNLSELNYIETITLPFNPESTSDAFNSKSDTVLDKILNITILVSAGIGTFVMGYMYLFLLAKFEIGI